MTCQPTSSLDLLELYDRSSPLFLSSPRHTLLALGVRASVNVETGHGQWHTLPTRVRSMLEDHAVAHPRGRSIIVGALPFDDGTPARLVLPECVCWAEPGRHRTSGPISSGRVKLFDARPVPDAEHYVEGVRQAIARIRQRELHKVVLARSLEMTAPSSLDITTLLRNLVRRNAGAYTFALDVSRPRSAADPANDDGESGARTLIGASPELLISRAGWEITANPLAGSASRSADPVEDARRAAALLQSTKDLREHAYVVEAVVEVLRPFCSALRVPNQPSLLKTASMWHLSTEIGGRLSDPSTCALRLATALHPTPAVCGTPTDKARSVIRELEGFQRGYYAGLVGWTDVSGDGEWIVTIRCGEVEDRRIRMFAGAGIVEDSDAEEELQETSAKFRTVLAALGLES